jgi:hypothetical protein
VQEAVIGDERVVERLVYSRLFDTYARDRSANGVDCLFATLDAKRLEVSLYAAAKAVMSTQFKQEPTGGATPANATRATQQEANLRTRSRP